MSEESTDSKRFGSTKSPAVEGQFTQVIAAEDFLSPDFYYPVLDKFKSPIRGLCLLINQRDFPTIGQSCRDGTDVDADRIERLFISLRYTVLRHFNVNRANLFRIIKEVAALDHRSFDSFVCFVLSHGEDGVVFATDGPVPTETIVGAFRGDNCPTLIGKPKLFFIQACRGARFDSGVAVPFVTDASNQVILTRLPVEADILMANSTVPGYFAWRNSVSGSWFIQELCRVLEEDRDSKQPHDIVTLLTVVARCVAYQYRSNTGMRNSHNMTQMTSFISTLTRLAYLTDVPLGK